MKIAIVQKCPSTVNYEQSFSLDNSPISVVNLSSRKVSKLLKRDVDLDISPQGFWPQNYDYVILVGSEALKMFTKATSVTDYTGKLAPAKLEYEGATFIASISPSGIAFKPEFAQVFSDTVDKIHTILAGESNTYSGNYIYLKDTKDILAYLINMRDNGGLEISLDTETSNLAPRDGYLLGVSMSDAPGSGSYLDADGFDADCVQALQEVVSTKAAVVLHNAKFDMNYLRYHFNIVFSQDNVHDTMLMHYILDERNGTHGLKPLAMKYTELGDYDRELSEYKDAYCRQHGIKKENFSYELIPSDVLAMYAAKDADATITLYYKFKKILESNTRLNDCYRKLMLPSLHFLTTMEDRGIPINKNRLSAARQFLVAELDKVLEELHACPEVLALEKAQQSAFNPNSVKQLRTLLFDYVGLVPTGKLTATGAISTDVEVLEELAELHRIPNLVLQARQKAKLINTYVDKLLPVIDTDSRVRTGFNQTATTSGRLSSSGKFNMQQLPRDNPIIKGCVVAPKGYKIVACDLATAEIYYAAVLSGDEAMQQVFINMQENPKKYPDFHSNIAQKVFALSCEPTEVPERYPALRQAAKAISFGILYGSGPSKVAESVNKAFIKAGEVASCSTEEAQEYIEAYFNSFPKLRRWINTCHNMIKQHGFIYSHFGRKRRLHNVGSSDRGVAASEVRSGFNAIIQSVSSDHLLLGAVEADIVIQSRGISAEIFALVHDSVVALVAEDQVEAYLEILIPAIQKDRGCSISGCPIRVTQDSEPGGSEDYSCGKLAKKFPELASIF